MKISHFTLKHYLIFLAVGSTDYLNEALFSLLSFFRHNTNFSGKIIVYTDTPGFFENYAFENVIYRSVSSAELKEWKGTDNYTYRIKTKVLQDVSKQYSGSFLFVDTDTVFRKNIASVFNEIDKGELFLDHCEGVLQTKKGGIAKKARAAFRKQNSFVLSTSEKVFFDKSFEVWNSGVVGFNSSHAGILKSTEELMDLLYGVKKLFVMEQIALSYFFQQATRPKPAENYIHHYWYFKEFRGILHEFFTANQSKTFAELTTEASRLDPEKLAIPKLAYKQKTFFEKTFQKLFYGYKWKTPKYHTIEN